ncbi:hypothetical protein GCM10027051_30900 [Niabella terrae]
MIGISQSKTHFVNWKQLAPIPDPVGFAGSFAGVSGGVLLVAGGANFPDNIMPWNGGQKKWYDDIYALRSPSGHWQRMGKLPRPLGYGLSLTVDDYWVIIGGSNENGHFSNVYALKIDQGKLRIDSWPSLPVTMANSCGAVVGNKLYVLGGLLHPDDRQTSKLAFSLDLQHPQKGWTPLPAFPGPSRMLAVAAAIDQTFYVCSGTQLVEGERRYLKDAYAFNEATGWTRLSDMPRSAVAAAGPAYSFGTRFFIFGGDDGSLAGKQLGDAHPGFSTEILGYNTQTDRWEVAGTIPVSIHANAAKAPNESCWAPVTTTLTVWNNWWVLPGGEVRPGTRTPHVRVFSVRHQ